MTRSPWAGRFTEDPDQAVQDYTRSLHVDRRLAHYDIQGSRNSILTWARLPWMS